MKSVMIIDSITEDLDMDEINLVSIAKSKKDELFTGIVNLWSNIVLFFSLTAFMGLGAFIFFNIQAGYNDATTYYWLVIPAALIVVEYFWLQRVKKEAPEKIVEFLSKLGIIK